MVWKNKSPAISLSTALVSILLTSGFLAPVSADFASGNSEIKPSNSHDAANAPNLADAPTKFAAFDGFLDKNEVFKVHADGAEANGGVVENEFDLEGTPFYNEEWKDNLDGKHLNVDAIVYASADGDAAPNQDAVANATEEKDDDEEDDCDNGDDSDDGTQWMIREAEERAREAAEAAENEDDEDDCDNGDDSDDGTQWKIREAEERAREAAEANDEEDDCDNGDDSDDGTQWMIREAEERAREAAEAAENEDDEDDCDNGDDSDDGTQWKIREAEERAREAAEASKNENEDEEDDCDNGDDSDDGTQWMIREAEERAREAAEAAKNENEDEEDDCDNGDDSDDGTQWMIREAEANAQPSFKQIPDAGASEDFDDCEVGDYTDDGTESLVRQEEISRSSGFHRPIRSRFSRTTAQDLAPFPKWLADLTGLDRWPGHDAPFIEGTGIDLSDIPNVPLRQLGDCSEITPEHCSFDCFRCITAPQEIMSCPVLSQTFDDGPSPATPKLLEQLASKTTFFVQGINVVRFPETFRQQHAQGHLLASHTWSHANLAGISNEDVAAQIQWSIWAMNATAGIVPRFFRPPYGASDNRVRAIIQKFGMMSVFWDYDTFDWQINDRRKTPMQVLDEVEGWKQSGAKGLILEHDSTIDTVNVGLDVAKILGSNQFTVAECVGGPWYLNA